MNKANPSKSYGCELQPVLFDEIEKLKTMGLIDHIQVTIPNTISFKEALRFSENLPTIAHCNILNPFGENDLMEIKPVIRQIRALNPIHVVEHFTAFRPSSTEKTGVYFDKKFLNPKHKSRLIDSISLWQDLLGCPLCLENVAIEKDVEAYFELLIEVKEQTGCQIACDLPHFFLSSCSGGLSENKIASISKKLSPIQLHIGGLSLANGVLKDNHKGFSPWLVSVAHSFFPDFKYMTLEQNHQIPASTVERNLMDCRSGGENVPELIKYGKGMPLEELNNDLARETAKNIGVRDSIRKISLSNCSKELRSSLHLYEKYQPFLFPIASVERGADNLTPSEIVQTMTALSRWSMAYQSWWYPDLPNQVKISFGEGENVLYSVPIFDGDESNTNLSKLESCFRVTTKAGFWCDVAAPRLPEPIATAKEFANHD